MTGAPGDEARRKARQAAQMAIAEARQATQLKFYGLIARQLPGQLRQHGLGQLLAMLQARGRGRADSPYTVLANQLQRRLAEVLPSGSGDLNSLTSQNSQHYLQATQQAEMFLTELAPFLEKFT